MGCKTSKVVDRFPGKKKKRVLKTSKLSKIFKRAKTSPRKSRTEGDIYFQFAGRQNTQGSMDSLERELEYSEYEYSSIASLSSNFSVPTHRENLDVLLIVHGDEDRDEDPDVLVIVHEDDDSNLHSGLPRQSPVIAEQSVSINRMAARDKDYDEGYYIIPGTVMSEES